MPIYTPEFGHVQLGSVAAGGHNPADSTEYAFGHYWGFNPGTVAGLTAFPMMPRAGRVRRAYIVYLVFGTTASAETFTVLVRNISAATTEAITTGMQMNLAVNAANNTGMSLAFNAGAGLAIQFTTPAWATNPTVVVYNAALEVEFL